MQVLPSCRFIIGFAKKKSTLQTWQVLLLCAKYNTALFRCTANVYLFQYCFSKKHVTSFFEVHFWEKYSSDTIFNQWHMKVIYDIYNLQPSFRAVKSKETDWPLLPGMVFFLHFFILLPLFFFLICSLTTAIQLPPLEGKGHDCLGATGTWPGSTRANVTLSVISPVEHLHTAQKWSSQWYLSLILC